MKNNMSLELKEQYDKIFKLCYFKIHDRDIAEDLTQETFLKYFSQTSYINRGKPLAYLYTTAKNLCTDFYRKNKPIPFDELDTLGTFDKAGRNTSVDELAPLETSIAVRQAVKTLTAEQQELLLLRFSNELSIGELAVVFNISRFAVRRRLNAALEELKKSLKKEDFA